MQFYLHESLEIAIHCTRCSVFSIEAENHHLSSVFLKDVESGSVQIAFDYDREEWKLTAEVIRASIIPADEEKEKKGKRNIILFGLIFSCIDFNHKIQDDLNTFF